ncbi:hypothetical protein LTR37_018805 [Vermiconidia calcicola]|uniref:Uncharacterized protein n=1 Tax=Vermiconidia calcicola TaxID=1690605 RepID=A0ACC3MJ08_9PEZI|nr:hypothetical protein LTR37_018805 [Vermiconidia calcicola]
MSSQRLSGRSADTQQFEYNTLQGNNIRTITILPLENGVVRCTIMTVDLTSNPMYKALSYTWGDPRPKGLQTKEQAIVEFPIYIDGKTKTVTKNLYDALTRLASGVLVLEAPVWIDAICINQGDLEEKNLQVSMMDEIYKNANMVVAWLGEADGFTEAGLQAIERLASINAGLEPADHAEHQQRDIRSFGLADRQWQGLVAVFCRAWFTRVWIIQEVTLARKMNVIIGTHIVPEDIMRSAATYLARSGLWFKLTRYVLLFSRHPNDLDSNDVPPLGAVIRSLSGLDAGIRMGGFHPKLVTLFGRGNEASDERDYVYGMAGLVKLAQASHREQSEALPPPRYDADVEEVIVDWAKWMVKNMDNYMLFSHVGDETHRRLKTLPSWVPDITTSLMPNTFIYLDQHRQWHPSGEDVAGKLSPVDGSASVQTRAPLFDTVTAVATSFGVMNDEHDYDPVLELIESLRGVTEPYRESSEALACTLTAGITHSHAATTLCAILEAWVLVKADHVISTGRALLDATRRSKWSGLTLLAIRFAGHEDSS